MATIKKLIGAALGRELMVIRKTVLTVVFLFLAACGRESTAVTPGEIPSPNPPKPRAVFRIEALPSPAPSVCTNETSEPCLELSFGRDTLAVCIKPLPPGSLYEFCEARRFVTPMQNLIEVIPSPWEWAAVSPDDRNIVIGFDGVQAPGFCEQFDRAEVVEKPDAFVITVFTGTDPKAAGVTVEDGKQVGDITCALPSSIPSVAFVTLSRPLGNKQLLDGSGKKLIKPSPEHEEPDETE